MIFINKKEAITASFVIIFHSRDDQIFGCIKCDFNLLIFNGAILYY